MGVCVSSISFHLLRRHRRARGKKKVILRNTLQKSIVWVMTVFIYC